MSRTPLLLAIAALLLGGVGFLGLAGDLSAAARLLFFVVAAVLAIVVLLPRRRRG